MPFTQSRRRRVKGSRPLGAAAATAAGKAARTVLLLALPLLLLLLAPLPLAGAQTPVPYATRFGNTNGAEVVRATAVDATGTAYVVGDYRASALSLSSTLRLTNAGGLTNTADAFVVRVIPLRRRPLAGRRAVVAYALIVHVCLCSELTPPL